MPACLIALGSNLGPSAETLNEAYKAFRACPEVSAVGISSSHLTQPIGGPPGQSGFLNAALILETMLAPEQLFELLQAIEHNLGRMRNVRWGPRKIDLDLLLYGDLVFESSRLVIPHPRMVFRRFVLGPAEEIASTMLHPTSGLTVGELLENLDSGPNYVASTGPMGVGKTSLARRLAHHFEGQFFEDPAAQDRFTELRPGSRSLPSEIELLRCRAEQLGPGRIASLGDTGNTVFVSDYWIEQSLRPRLGDGEKKKNEGLATLWESLSLRVVRPKLILALSAPPRFLYESCQTNKKNFSDFCSIEEFERYHLAFSKWIRLPGHGPIFHLDVTDDDLLWSESVAAIQAMQ